MSRFLGLLFVFRMQILSLDKELLFRVYVRVRIFVCVLVCVRGTDYTAVCQCRSCLRDSSSLLSLHLLVVYTHSGGSVWSPRTAS